MRAIVLPARLRPPGEAPGGGCVMRSGGPVDGARRGVAQRELLDDREAVHVVGHAAEHGNEGEFKLPKSWMEKKALLDNDKTPFNFVMTADIIGGNSGSPVVNRNNEFVGIIFDGNIESLPWDYQFDERVGRAVAVHSAGILDALKKVYGVTDLVKELTGK